MCLGPTKGCYFGHYTPWQHSLFRHRSFDVGFSRKYSCTNEGMCQIMWHMPLSCHTCHFHMDRLYLSWQSPDITCNIYILSLIVSTIAIITMQVVLEWYLRNITIHKSSNTSVGICCHAVYSVYHAWGPDLCLSICCHAAVCSVYHVWWPDLCLSICCHAAVCSVYYAWWPDLSLTICCHAAVCSVYHAWWPDLSLSICCHAAVCSVYHAW